MSGFAEKGCESVGKMEMDWTRTGEEKRMAARLPGPWGSRTHHWSSMPGMVEDNGDDGDEQPNLLGHGWGKRARGRGS